MLDTKIFGNALKARGFNFYSGVPCSFLKDLINYAINECDYVMAANEGDAAAICTGARLGGKKSVLLMQNSGLGNAVSPLTSLNAVFHIPVLGFVSLRGEKGLADESQHELMGPITAAMLDTMKIDNKVLSTGNGEAEKQLDTACECVNSGKSFFFIVKKGTFSGVALDVNKKPAGKGGLYSRSAMLKAAKRGAGGESLYLATTGFTGRELYELGDDPNNLYMAGSLGCVSSLGLGLALARPDRGIVVLDGDGSLLMRMGSLAVNAWYMKKSAGKPGMFHVLFDNFSHESTGGQFTVSPGVDFPALAKAVGYPVVVSAASPDELEAAAKAWKRSGGLVFAYCPVALRDPRAALGRPEVKPPAVARRLVSFIDGGSV
ncbi:MAG: phosphonopyruvate decarboxylase [Treponema sp.]|jgi:phosphonopyruvate decarboxylase|nr:phosphonopyruvate decarboxylase [Treponema sp.]